MNDDSGPTIPCPWKLNIMPKITIMMPGITIATELIKLNQFSQDKNAMLYEIYPF